MRICQDPPGGSVGRDCRAKREQQGPDPVVQAGQRRATQGDHCGGEAAGRSAVSRHGAEDRADVHPGLAECSPRT